jgi:hypothetical protein
MIIDGVPVGLSGDLGMGDGFYKIYSGCLLTSIIALNLF